MLIEFFSDSTDGWSACSVHDFTYRFNKLKTSFCLPQVNLGKECLAQCNDKSGLCEGFCGTKNYCCKKGDTDNGCDGKDGGENSHVCVLEPLGIMNMPMISFFIINCYLKLSYASLQGTAVWQQAVKTVSFHSKAQRQN